MNHRRYDAMRHAVHLARSGLFTDWSSVAARLRVLKYRGGEVDWTPGQRQWLDRLCAEARCTRQTADSAYPRLHLQVRRRRRQWVFA
jgi:hypothetical protein